MQGPISGGGEGPSYHNGPGLFIIIIYLFIYYHCMVRYRNTTVEGFQKTSSGEFFEKKIKNEIIKKKVISEERTYS